VHGGGTVGLRAGQQHRGRVVGRSAVTVGQLAHREVHPPVHEALVGVLERRQGEPPAPVLNQAQHAIAHLRIPLVWWWCGGGVVGGVVGW